MVALYVHLSVKVQLRFFFSITKKNCCASINITLVSDFPGVTSFFQAVLYDLFVALSFIFRLSYSRFHPGLYNCFSPLVLYKYLFDFFLFSVGCECMFVLCFFFVCHSDPNIVIDSM